MFLLVSKNPGKKQKVFDKKLGEERSK